MGGGIGRVSRHSDYYLSDGSVSILTGDRTLFRVHKSFFVRESEFFSDMFAGAAQDEPQAGTDDLPFTLDVTSEEFACFLWVWYDKDYAYHEQTKDGWITILRLSSRWGFHKIKELALRELDELRLSPAERISIYNEHGIDSDRLVSSYVELCKSPKITPADGELLQMETLINILQAREDAQRKARELGHQSPTSASLEDETLRDIVSKFFKTGLTPRSNGNPTGSGAQASDLNGEHAQGTIARQSTITLSEPQVPDRKTQSSGGTQSRTTQNKIPEKGAQDKHTEDEEKESKKSAKGKEAEKKGPKDKEQNLPPARSRNQA